ncbi:MAG: acetylxylan esterase [Sedimentisphaerales bacterium]|nr:acetylxylan esterase [Sedimentisphaerales bacterium]
MYKREIIFALVIIFLLPGVGLSKDLRVLPEIIDDGSANDMMSRYLRDTANRCFENWKQQYEQRKSPEQIAEYQKRIRAEFAEAIGDFPQRTPLNPRIVGKVRRKGYRIEKVIFESQPRHYVSALLFLPNKRKGRPFPGVLIPCGHSENGKAYESYQTMAALLAVNGMVALVFDPIDQGERSQLPEKLPSLWGTKAHTMLGVGSILLGRNTAWFEIWDGMRAIDYLESRREVDGDRIGCTGNSGGGTQTSYLMSLDDRIKAAAPSCYITNIYERILDLGAQDAEQNIFGQLAFGMDHADYLMLRAPMPIMICAATQDFFDIRGTWQSFRYAKRLYSRMGFAERIDLLENDAPHNYNRLQRQSVARWMSRWLLGRDKPITEPNIVLLSEEETTCAPDGLVMNIEGARSTYDLNRDFEKQLARRRRELWTNTAPAELLERVRKTAGIRPLADIPAPKVEETGVIEGPTCKIHKLILKPEEGIYLPALKFVPEQTPAKGLVLYLHEAGKDADAAENGPIDELLKTGRIVLAVDIRGTGETQQNDKKNYFKPDFGIDGIDVFTAYLLGRSYVGMRAEDILVCTRFLLDSHGDAGPAVDIIAIGHVGIPALHAAALEPALFDSVKLKNSLISWANVIESGLSFNQFINTVHEALTTYDLPDLARLLEDRLTIEAPRNALGEVIDADCDDAAESKN